MSKKMIVPLMVIGFVVIAAATWQIVVYAPIVPGSCYEADSGLDWGTQSVTSALLTGITNSTTINGTQYVSFTDTCQGNNLIEGVCGSSYGYPALAGILNLSCSELGNYSCLNGACVPTPTNALPDLIIMPAGYSWGVSNVNGTLFYNLNLNANVKNNGNATAGNSTTRFAIANSSINIATGSLIPGQTVPLYNNIFQLTSGNYTATITADTNGQVQESNEFNNIYSLAINLP